MTRSLAALALCFAVASIAKGADSTGRLVASPPLAASAPPQYTPAAGRQDPVDLIPVSGGFLIVWADIPGPFGQLSTIRVTRAREDGSIIDRVGLPVFETFLPESVAAVPAGDGARLYWMSLSPSNRFEVFSLTVSGEGAISTPERVGELPADSPGGRLKAASAGSNTLLYLGRYVIVVDGNRLLRLTDIGGWGSSPTIAVAGNRVLITWVAPGLVLMGQTLSVDGDVIGPAGGTGIASSAYDAVSATDGSAVLLVHSTVGKVGLTRFDLDAGTFESTSELSGYAPGVAWNGVRYLVTLVTNEGSNLVGVDVDSNGVPDATTRSLLTAAGPPYMIAIHESILIAYGVYGGCFHGFCETDVWSARVDRDASSPSTERMIVSASARAQRAQHVVSVEEGWFAVWREGGAMLGGLTAGNAPATPFEVPDTLSAEGEGLVSDGRRVCVLDFERDDAPAWWRLRARLIERDGSLTAALPSPVADASPGAPAPHGVAAAWSGETILAAWRRSSDGTVLVARIPTDGQPGDMTPIVIGPSRSGSPSVTVAYDAGAFLVLWADIDDLSPPLDYVIRGARVSGNGVVAPFVVAVSGEALIYPSFACGEGLCLAAWTRYFEGNLTPSSVEAVLFRADDGSVASSVMTLGDESVPDVGPHVAWNGRELVLAWSARISSESVVRVVTMEPGAAAFGGPVTVGTTTSALDETVAIACSRNVRCLTLYQAPTDDLVHGRSVRLFQSEIRKTRARGVHR